MSPAAGTLAPNAVTTPDILSLNGKLTLFLGAVAADQERLIRVPMAVSETGQPIAPSLSMATILLTPGPAEFDCLHVFDPAAVTRGSLYLYYSAIGTGPDRIGRARSNDGRVFTKLDHAVCLGRSPEAACRDGRMHLFYVQKAAGTGYRIHLTIEDSLGVLESPLDQPVVDTGAPGSWDAYEVTTPRVFEREGTYYMIYAGGAAADRPDLPAAFGLARSRDLREWEKYPRNPVFGCGEAGRWDDGAMWFGTVFETAQELFLLYEAGRLADLSKDTPGLTQIGLAKVSCADFDHALKDW